MPMSPRVSRRAATRLVAAWAAASVCVAGLAFAQAAPATSAPSTARPATTAPATPRPAAPARAAAPAAAQPAAPTPEEIFAAWDKDKTRSLSLNEFKAGWEEVRQASLMSRIGGQFRAVDADRDGSLTPAEYGNLPLIKRAGSAAPTMASFDTDRNGKLDFREYIRMVEGLVKSASSAEN
jgi:Ca2+-binding EF-hand superfamily protein